MYQRILVPLDGSNLAEQALPYVRVLGRKPGSRVELFGVVPKHCVYDRSIASGSLNRANDYLKTVALPMREYGLEVTTTACEGDPADCIVTEAEKEPSTLITMSIHGRTSVRRYKYDCNCASE